MIGVINQFDQLVFANRLIVAISRAIHHKKKAEALFLNQTKTYFLASFFSSAIFLHSAFILSSAVLASIFLQAAIFSSMALGSFMAPPCEPAKEAIETVAKTPAMSADKNLFMKISLRIG